MTDAPLLEIGNLSLGIPDIDLTIVRNASLTIKAAETVGIVGESGSGKTMLGRAVIGLSPPPVRVTEGDIRFRGASFRSMSEKAMRAIRGPGVSMIFQEPMTSLNPSMTIGRQMEEGLALHGGIDANERRRRILAMLERVGIGDGERLLRAYPHEFSGGMRQRIMIASAMLLKPALLIADEPTTALDAVTQRDIMDLLAELTREYRTAVMLISHDLPMVARYADRIVVMQHGDIVETGRKDTVLAAPAHDYTRKLLSSLPVRGPSRPKAEGDPLISVEKLGVTFMKRGGLFARNGIKQAVRGVNLDIRAGEVVAVVGGSGSGKTTLARAIAGLTAYQSGAIRFRGLDLSDARGQARAQYRRQCHMVFQDPFSSLDPRMKVGELIAESLCILPEIPQSDHARLVSEALADVSLDPGLAERYPHQLSGGQRQRVAIARALVRRPSFVIADEAVSALDVTVRAQVLALLADLQRKYGFACLFITHDLAVVEQIADRVIVMQNGEIVEEGTRDEILDEPRHPYTLKLLSAIPVLEPTNTGGLTLKWRHTPVSDATPLN
ncbi:ABC transporter ATP-binding protein [Rhizobiaceae bacterium BDR2-2]|uniref:ABC transporter ATP-binding protein n=1 Tax=Ectorhizobium quercum TaxID=2965071 RepID=A0AAE3MWV0_9HYPH|nr:ABC transporter ATP-binding protein [Ectorhizobium quercum]MCX8995906.1 ABC transporter ATP-binding protein [Ectorhizobium quercum]